MGILAATQKTSAAALVASRMNSSYNNVVCVHTHNFKNPVASLIRYVEVKKIKASYVKTTATKVRFVS